MKRLSCTQIRDNFLTFFQNNDHLKIKSSSLVPKNDNTLLFINSGMAPLKRYFLGLDTPTSPRLCNIQPCVRTIDIDDVGDRHHMTFFEMLGSWSIGDYYKEKAIELAYELLVNHFGFDPEKLYVTIFNGDEALGIGPDLESSAAWEKVGIKKDHIVPLGVDNFWGPAGEVGPCGPCTEVFFDTGEKFGKAYVPGGEFDSESRYIEIWNAGVFMELNKLADGTYDTLPLKSVDTGSGLERMAMIMNGVDSVYEIDLVKPILELVQRKYKGLGEQKERMLTDHIRTTTMLLSEGVLPSNEGQGYIPRRLIRKCVATLASKGVEKIDFQEIVKKVIELMGPSYPHLQNSVEIIMHHWKLETDDFLPVIKQGIKRIENQIQGLSTKVFPGEFTFELVTTFGMPYDVIENELQERGFTIDRPGFDKCYEDHRNVSRVVKKAAGVTFDQDDIKKLLAGISDTEFVGYRKLKTDASLLFIISQKQAVNSVSTGQQFWIAADKTPFYAEAGGQVGDVGVIKTSVAEGKITDTIKVDGIYLHVGTVISGEIKLADVVQLEVSAKDRQNTCCNHSVTHLLHAALHEVVGKHALQKGSLVGPTRLRFDFTHQKALSGEELAMIEHKVNEWIRTNAQQKTDVMDYQKALKSGALALFGENYDELVRVVSFDGTSVELCGGTHVSNLGEIGQFVIICESSIARGVRRIEATTGAEAIQLMQQKNKILKEATSVLGVNNAQLVPRIKELRQKVNDLTKAAQKVEATDVKFLSEKKFKINEELVCVMASTDLASKKIKELGDTIIQSDQTQILCLIGIDKNAARVFTWVDKQYAGKINASKLLQILLAPIDGKGGGKPNFAQGGGSKIENVGQIFNLSDSISTWVQQLL
ncbi:MAG: alanine--tRNA ligase [Bacteriovoracaceae bacterium]|nr:alanine--tRNA ligase [Bacteriovoracaceae bacterium]